MRKRLLLAAFAAAVFATVFILWPNHRKLSKPRPALTLPTLPLPLPLPLPAQTDQPDPTVTPTAAAAPTPAAPVISSRLDPTSELFRERLDELIPSRLYAAAAHCYGGGGNDDQKLKLGFKLEIADSEVSARDVHVLKSTLASAGLERCIIASVSTAHWRDDNMPDFESDDEELLIRLSGFRKYRGGDSD